MPSIRGSLIHVPGPPPKGRFRSAGEKVAGRAAKTFGPSARRAKSAGSGVTGNRTSRPGTRASFGPRTTYGNSESGRFGRLTGEHKEDKALRRGIALGAGLTGVALGAGTADLAVGTPARQRYSQIKANQRVINRNKKKLEKRLFPKRETVHLITDVGTKAGRAQDKLYRGIHPGHYGTVGLGVGAGGYTALTHHPRKQQKAKLKAQKTTLATQRAQLRKTGVTKMDSVSAFGVDHAAEIFKAEPKYTKGRAVTATVAGPYHGLVAAKKGKKLRTAGRSLGYGFGGGVVGQMAGGLGAAAVTRGRSAGAIRTGSSIGGMGGSSTGAYQAFKTSNRKGYYKPQKKKK